MAAANDATAHGDGSEDGPSDIVLYPPGGAFNKLRKMNYFDSLMEAHWYGYSNEAPNKKKSYVRRHILSAIQKSGRTLKVFRGKHPDRGSLVVPNDTEMMELVAQKLRDMKKRMLLKHRQEGGSAMVPKPKPKPKPKRKARSPPRSIVNKAPISQPGDESDENAPNDQSVTLDEIPASELKAIIWSQWDHIDNWRRFCASQKETIEKLTLVNSHQHQMLAAQGFSDFGHSDAAGMMQL